ncbi:hypothetical protein MY4824_009357 [Beauveria thailandica]
MEFYTVIVEGHQPPINASLDNISKLNDLLAALERCLLNKSACLNGRCTVKLRKPGEDARTTGMMVLEWELVPACSHLRDANITTAATNLSVSTGCGTANTPSDIQPFALTSLTTEAYESFETWPESNGRTDTIFMNSWGLTWPSQVGFTPTELPTIAASDNGPLDSTDSLPHDPLRTESFAIVNTPSEDGSSAATLSRQPSSTVRGVMGYELQSPADHAETITDGCLLSPIEYSHISTSRTDGSRVRKRRTRSLSGLDEHSTMGIKLDKSSIYLIKAAQSIVRSDYLEFLESELPRWVKRGLWEYGTDIIRPVSNGTDYYNLQVAYSTVCLLEARTQDDCLRSRIALVELHREYERTCAAGRNSLNERGVGCGISSSVIDLILGQIHQDWDALDDVQRKARRARFHNHKRYGKRWTILADSLGKAILILCSPTVARIV